MKLNRYGMEIKQWLKNEHPIRYQELILDGTLMEKIYERQNEVMEYRDDLIKTFKLADAKNGFLEKVRSEREIQNEIEEMLKEVMYRKF